MNYIIVSPVKNEAKHIKNTLDSVMSQTIKPKEWVIVDDGSTDDTLAILKEYESKCSWIKIVENKTHDESRAGGSKVVRAFYKGYEFVKDKEYDFIVKLDGDLKLPDHYFETVIEHFNKDPKVGLSGGYVMNKIGDDLVQEGDISYHVRGAFKSVRKECFADIGGFKHVWNWDGLDEMEAMRLGWKTAVFELPVIHYRPTSGAYDFRKQNYKHGFEAYKTRDSLILTLIRFLAKSAKKPHLSGIYFLKGYFHGFFKREPRVISKELSRFANKFHLKRIVNTVFSI